jgi:hypothetical protein
MSFQITLTPAKRAAGRYVGLVRRKLQKALADRTDLTQADIARELDVNRSVITRQLRGSADMSLARVAEIATILGYEPDFVLHPIIAQPGQNVPPSVPSVGFVISKSTTGVGALAASIKVPA